MISHMIDDHASSKLMEKLATFLLKDAKVTFVICLLFVGYIAGAIYGLIQLETVEDPKDLTPNGSYLISFYNNWDVK